MKQIILKDGTKVALDVWQKGRELEEGKLSENFEVWEFKCKSGAEEYFVSELVIDLLQKLRTDLNKPLKINAGYRTEAHQRTLQKDKSLKAATWSPHCKGMAADIDTKTREESLQLAQSVLKTAMKMGLKIRVGVHDYLNTGATFVHFDVCPEYYGPGMPYHETKHPIQWETAYSVW